MTSTELADHGILCGLGGPPWRCVCGREFARAVDAVNHELVLTAGRGIGAPS